MNCCWSCHQEFGYWEIWRSWWASQWGARAQSITCPSCGEYNFAASGGRFLLNVLTIILVVYWVIRLLDLIPQSASYPVSILAYLVVIGFLVFVFSFLVPFVALFGRKPKHLER
jgi:CXXC-20-CXXC protein